ncbi:MAG: CopD family protein [Gammaproteobacteria bacterium]|nr:CopD family protein [Gammaproteobacteria bacterium]MDH5304843.1 CopD family protein [Gammaproteobacteria bacterium]MDH5322451.1 CopD family protein [Gammaproteobacteria bacterium]
MTAHYLWFKGLHIVFVVTWFAGLFYLPRLFIYHTMASDAISRERFELMETRLFVIMTIGAVLASAFGIWMLFRNPGLLQLDWVQLKLVLLASLLVFHWRCFSWMRRLRISAPSTDTRWLRWFNEIPSVLLIAIVLLAVLKPS